MKILLISTVILSITYISFRIFLRNETNFKQLRAYLLLSVLVSLILPFNTFKISPAFIQKQNLKISEHVKNNSINDKTVSDFKTYAPVLNNKEIKIQKTIDWFLLIKIIYILIVCVLLIKVFIQITVLIYKFLRSDKKRMSNCILVYNHGFKNSFSFFNWIFVNENEKSESDIEKIVAHEMIHVNQYHSFDIIVIELLAAFMWLNPFVWMMRKSIHLVHEYLADEGVLNKGINKVSYLELLLNQVAEERLISISSSFNQSLIKKRIIMMNNIVSRKNGIKIYAIIPLAVILFLGISCVNGQNADEKVVTAIAPTKMNVLYVGIENPINIAVSGYESSEIELEILDNAGEIFGKNGNYNIIPKNPGLIVLVVRAKGNIVQEAKFRAKTIPDPFAMLNRKTGGQITKEDLLKQEEIKIMLANFDFDVKFEVVGFSVSTTNRKGYTLAVSSDSNKISKSQKDLIKTVEPRSKIIFDDISVKGPDGNISKVSPMVFEIVE